VFVAATSDQIQLSFQPTSDNGGSAVTEYNLYAAVATLDGAAVETYIEVNSCGGLLMACTLVRTTETSQTFTTGVTYRFRFSATNVIGEGELSNSVTVSLAAPAVQPAKPVLDRATTITATTVYKSTKTSLYLTWAAVTPLDALEVDGYKLYMTKQGTGAAVCVYDGSRNNQKLFYNVTGLETGKRYSFYVVSVNANGVSAPSDELVVIICLPPTGFPKPKYLSSTKTSMTLGWEAPSDSGGCPLLTYTLYINDGLGGASFTSIDSTALQDKPYLTQHTVTQPAGGGALVTGQAYRFKLRATNEVGHVESTNFAEFVVASVPLAPPTPPSQNFAYTDRDRIRIEYAALTSSPAVSSALATDGGSAVLSYDLWRDDGLGGDFSTLYSQASSQSILALTFTDFNVQEGVTYRYKYRARNINGWGAFSGVAYLFAAAKPDQPAAPTLLSVTDDSIGLQLHAPTATGGADILGVNGYELLMDDGTLNSASTKVNSYSGSLSSLTHTLQRTTDSMTAGRIYSITFRAQNAVGWSPASAVLRVGLGAEPPAITSLQANLAGCGPTFVALSWSAVVAALQLPVLGYVVQMIDPVTDEWIDVYDASNDPDALSYTHFGVITGESYVFRVFAVNFNGRST